MKRIATLLGGLLLGSAAQAQISITSSLSYTQNFDALDTANTPSTNLPAGWQVFESGTGAAADNMYVGNNGSSNSGNVFSYGSAGSTDRALGSIASGSNHPYFGAAFVNNSGSVITSVTISYTEEQWRQGNSAPHNDTTLFMWSTAAAGVSDTSATAMWMDEPALMMNSIITGDTATGAKDGNTNTLNKTATMSVNIPVGSMFVIRWSDMNIGGADDGLAVDNMSVTFTNGSGGGCAAPIGLTATNITTGGADLSWTAVTGATEYFYVVDQSSADPASAGTSNGTATTTTAASLNASTTYYLHVMTSCGGGDMSPWATQSFTTMSLGVAATSALQQMPLAVIGQPVSGEVKLAFTLKQAGAVSIEVMDATGRRVAAETVAGLAGAQQRALMLNLPAGLYTVRAVSGKQTAVVKAVVQ